MLANKLSYRDKHSTDSAASTAACLLSVRLPMYIGSMCVPASGLIEEVMAARDPSTAFLEGREYPMNERLVRIDGSQGEGGGQILRSSLALSLVTRKPFVIENIRASRSKPGLGRQHLAAALAAAKVGRADMQGASLGSRRLVFKPDCVHGGNYEFRVGTAGSATLVLQTVLSALLSVTSESTMTIEGGTHNPMVASWCGLEIAEKENGRGVHL